MAGPSVTSGLRGAQKSITSPTLATNVVPSTEAKSSTRYPTGCSDEHCLGGCQKPSCLKQLRDRKQDLQTQRSQLETSTAECMREFRALTEDAHSRWGVDNKLCDENDTDNIDRVKVKCRCLSCEVEHLRVQIIRDKQCLALLREKMVSLQDYIEARSKEEEQASPHAQTEAATISDTHILAATFDHQIAQSVTAREDQHNDYMVEQEAAELPDKSGTDDSSGDESGGDEHSDDESRDLEDPAETHYSPPPPRVQTARFKGLSGKFCVQPQEYTVPSYSQSDYYMHPAREELERQFTYDPESSRTGSYRHNGAGQLKLGGPRLNSNYAGMASYGSDQPSATGKKPKKPMLGR